MVNIQIHHIIQIAYYNDLTCCKQTHHTQRMLNLCTKKNTKAMHILLTRNINQVTAVTSNLYIFNIDSCVIACCNKWQIFFEKLCIKFYKYTPFTNR